MSPVLEEASSGSPLPRIVGGMPTITAKMAGMENECLIDTSSMVTLISVTFDKEKLKSVCSRVHGIARSKWARNPIPCVPGIGHANDRSDDPRMPGAGPQRQSSHCASAEMKTRSPVDECAWENPRVGELLRIEGNASTSLRQSQKPRKQRLVKVACNWWNPSVLPKEEETPICDYTGGCIQV